MFIFLLSFMIHYISNLAFSLDAFEILYLQRSLRFPFLPSYRHALGACLGSAHKWNLEFWNFGETKWKILWILQELAGESLPPFHLPLTHAIFFFSSPSPAVLAFDDGMGIGVSAYGTYGRVRYVR